MSWLVALAAMQLAAAAAAEQPAGRGASLRLLFNLVDRLLDACDLQLQSMLEEESSKWARSFEGGASDEGRLEVLLEENELSLAEDGNRPLVDYLATTKPMLSAQLERRQCWREATKWLRKQLIEIRMRLLTSSTGAPADCCLSESLVALANLEGHLRDVCPSWVFGGQDKSSPGRMLGRCESGFKLNRLPGAGVEMAPLNYVIESIEMLAELAREALGRPRPVSAGRESEQEACLVIGLHQQLLTDLADAFELIEGAATQVRPVDPNGRGDLASLMSEILAPIARQSAKLRDKLASGQAASQSG